MGTTIQTISLPYLQLGDPVTGAVGIPVAVFGGIDQADSNPLRADSRIYSAPKTILKHNPALGVLQEVKFGGELYFAHLRQAINLSSNSPVLFSSGVSQSAGVWIGTEKVPPGPADPNLATFGVWTYSASTLSHTFTASSGTWPSSGSTARYDGSQYGTVINSDYIVLSDQRTRNYFTNPSSSTTAGSVAPGPITLYVTAAQDNVLTNWQDPDVLYTTRWYVSGGINVTYVWS